MCINTKVPKERPHHGVGMASLAKKPRSATSSTIPKTAKERANNGVAPDANKPKRVDSNPSTIIKNWQPVNDANLFPAYHDLGKIIYSKNGSKWQGDKFVGAHVAKVFGQKWLYGTVDKYHWDETCNDRLWHVIYDDGDHQEDMNEVELNYWLMRYNVLYVREMLNNMVPYREWEQKPDNASKEQEYFKVTFTLQKDLKEINLYAFVDCHGEEEQCQREEEILGDEMELPLSQMNGLFQSAAEANSVAYGLVETLLEDCTGEEIETDIKCELSSSHCKKWSWSYIEFDEMKNSFLCQGYVQVEKVTKWCQNETE